MSDAPRHDGASQDPEDIDATGHDAPANVDTVTGEILPTTVSLGRDIAALPDDLGELAALFSEPEMSPTQVVRWILGEETLEENDPEETARAIMARILTAGSADQVLNGHKVIHGLDILETPIRIHAVKWQRSTLGGASSCYAVISAERIDSGEYITVTTSGRNVMVQLIKMSMNGWLPVVARITKSANPTANGFWPLWLEPA